MKVFVMRTMGSISEVDGTGVAGEGLAHLARRLPGMEPTYQFPLLDQIRPSRRDTLVVVLIAASQARDGSPIHYVQVFATELPPEDHYLFEPVILVDVVRLGEVAEGLMGENPSQNGVEDYGVFAASDLGRREQAHCLLCYVTGLLMKAFHNGEVTVAAQADAGLLDFRPVPCRSRQSQAHVDSLLFNIVAFRTGEDHPLVAVPVSNQRRLDAFRPPT